MVYIDNPIKGWCHLVADSIQELHCFALANQVPRHRFENKRGKNQPHYDIRYFDRDRLIKAGAIPITRKGLFIFLQQTYQPNEQDQSI